MKSVRIMNIDRMKSNTFLEDAFAHSQALIKGEAYENVCILYFCIFER
jgi:hypothetical protein